MSGIGLGGFSQGLTRGLTVGTAVGGIGKRAEREDILFNQAQEEYDYKKNLRKDTTDFNSAMSRFKDKNGKWRSDISPSEMTAYLKDSNIMDDFFKVGADVDQETPFNRVESIGKIGPDGMASDTAPEKWVVILNKADGTEAILSENRTADNNDPYLAFTPEMAIGPIMSEYQNRGVDVSSAYVTGDGKDSFTLKPGDVRYDKNGTPVASRQGEIKAEDRNGKTSEVVLTNGQRVKESDLRGMYASEFGGKLDPITQEIVGVDKAAPAYSQWRNDSVTKEYYLEPAAATRAKKEEAVAKKELAETKKLIGQQLKGVTNPKTGKAITAEAIVAAAKARGITPAEAIEQIRKANKKAETEKANAKVKTTPSGIPYG